ncbi:MAG: hypothetical protein IPG81_23960 [Sandaracinaceae bacterium]|nr:hypothetical protein [Sandaracinaceae bacterium]
MRPAPEVGVNFFEPRQTPALFGLGLVDRIPEATLLALADPVDVDMNGISGRAHVLPDGRVGRFGWKADVPSLAEFTRDALSVELGPPCRRKTASPSAPPPTPTCSRTPRSAAWTWRTSSPSWPDSLRPNVSAATPRSRTWVRASSRTSAARGVTCPRS